MKEITKNYRKYKWFYTSSEKLVIGGKSAEQNDELLTEMKKTEKDFIVMHTSHPGSPFSVIISDVSKVNKKDLNECAIFTGCFSKAWKDGKKETEVHIFRISQVGKKHGMKTGTWQVSGNIHKVRVTLKLVLTKQKNVYRAVPESAAEKVLLKISPGKIDKTKMIDKIFEILKEDKNKKDDLLSALPAGGVEIYK